MPSDVEVSASAVNVSRRDEVLWPGMASGLLGGALMALFLMAAAGVVGLGPLYPLQVIGTTLVGPEGLERSVIALSAGLLLHLALSAACGVLFAAFVHRDMPLPCAIGVGVGYAFLVLGVMASLVVPAVSPLFREKMQPIGGSWVIAHAVFGASLGFAPALRGISSRALGFGPRPREAPRY